MRNTSDLEDLAEDGVKRAIAAGAASAEVYVVRSRTTGIIASGPYVSPTAGEVAGVGVRLTLAGKLGTAGILSHAGLDDAIARALALARRAAAAPGFTFLPPAPAHAATARASAGDDEEQLGLLQGLIDRVATTSSVTFSQFTLRRVEKEIATANSAGRSAQDAIATGYFEGEIRVSRGTADRTSRVAYDVQAGRFGRIDAAATAASLIEQATLALDPSPLPRTQERVLLHPAPTAQILGLLGNAFSGAFLATGRDPFDHAARFSEGVEILDDPAGKRRVDDEGTPTQPRALVRGGEVVGHLHDTRTAEILKTVPTGNGFRPSVKSAVNPRPNRLVLAPGDRTLDELIEELGEGVLITQPLLGAFASDKMTADVTGVAPFAFYVKGGKIQHALPPTGVGGNAHRVFQAVHAIGREPTECPHARAPAIVSGGITCAT